MNPKRKETIERCANLVQSMLPKSNNGEITRKWLESLTDKEFDELMVKFANGEEFLQIITPVGEDDFRLDTDTLQKVADENGVNLYHRIWIKDDEGGYELSNKKSMVIHLPIRIQQQLIAKKVSIPKDNDHIDVFTGQVTSKESKAARLSYPEVNSLLAMGLIKTVEEMMHFRGGSENGVRLIEQSIMQMGRASANALKPYTGNVGSTMMLHSYLTAMMLRTTLLTKVGTA